MTNVCEIIVAAVMRSLCLLHFEGFESLHEQLPIIHSRFSQLHPQSEIINQVFSLFPGFPSIMTKQKWKELHAWSTSETTNLFYGVMFHNLARYAIQQINSCPQCKAFSDPDQTEAIQIRHEQVFVSSLRTQNRMTILKAAKKYPSCGDEYVDSSRYLGEYHRMEMKLMEARQKISRCREVMQEKTHQYRRERHQFREERHQLRQQVLEGEWRIQELEQEIRQLQVILNAGANIGEEDAEEMANGNGNGNGNAEEIFSDQGSSIDD